MPVVLLSIDLRDTSTPVLARVQQALALLDAAATRTTTGMGQLGLSLTRMGADSAYVTQQVARMTAVLAGATTDLAGMTGAVDRVLASMQKLAQSDLSSGSSTDALVQSVRTLTGSLADVTILVDSYTAALGRMDAAQLAAAGSARLLRFGGVGSGNGTSSAGLGGEQTPTGVLARGAATDVGLGGRAALAGLGGVGISAPVLVGAGVVYAGYKATQAASNFWSAVAQAGAQSGTLQSPVDLHSFGQSLIDYAASGKSMYSATQLAQGAEVPLASGYSLQAIQQAMPALANLSAQNAAPDLGTADQLVTSLATAFGTGPASTGAQLTGYADFASKAEQLTKAQPGAITTAMPTVLGALPGTGVGIEDATSLLLKMGTVNPRLQTDAQAIRQLIQSTQVKPTAGALKEASSIGLAIGPGSAAEYGGILGWLQALQTASGGKASIISKILPQKNALSAYNDIFAGGGLTQTAGYSTQLGQASGTGQSAFDQLALGTKQQEVMLGTRFNADMIALGTTINTTVVPALLAMAGGALTAAEKTPGFLQNPQGALDASIKPLITSIQQWEQQHLSWLPGYGVLGGTPTPGSSTTAAKATVPWNYSGPLAPGETRAAAPGSVPQHLVAASTVPVATSSAPTAAANAAVQPPIPLSAFLAQQDPSSVAAKLAEAAQNAITRAPFHTPNPGQGGLEAGFQNTAVRFSGGANPVQQQLLKLTQENAQLRQEVTGLLQQIANNTRTQKTNTARTSPLAGAGTNRSPHA